MEKDNNRELSLEDITILLDIVEEKYRIYEFLCSNKKEDDDTSSDYLLMNTYLELSEKLNLLLVKMKEN